MYGNAEYARIIGLRNHLDVIGRSDFDMPCETVNCAEMFREQDKHVIKTEKKMRILDIHPFAGNEWKAYIFTKTPLIEDEKIIGTIFHGTDITKSSVIELGSVLSRVSEKNSSPLTGQNSYSIGNLDQSLNLTTRQSEVLFYLIRGKTCEKIAKVLNLSVRTIYDHVESLKFKILSASKYELIDRAIEKGYLNMIPESLFQTQLSVSLDE